MFERATIVFDLDGTLVDTAPDLTHALNHALSTHGHVPVEPALVRESAGRGASAMIETALRHNGARPTNTDPILAAFLTHYEANIAVESRPFPGAVALLARLSAAGARLAICTNKREALARLLLQELEINEFFSGIAGRDTFAATKPDPGHLLGAIALTGGEPARALMVGDSAVDVTAARAAGVPSVLVRHGYCPPAENDPQADAEIDHFDAFEAQARPLLVRLTSDSPASS